MAPTNTMILCDTNILIEFYKANPAVVERLETLGVENLAVSVITHGELYFGAFNKAELRQIRRHLDLLHTMHITPSISQRFLDLMTTYSLSHSLSVPDALIMATALDHDMPLYTFNLKDFRFIPGLNLYRPSN